MQRCDLEGIKEEIEKLQDAFYAVKDAIKANYPNLYERWKAEGFIVDDNIVCNTDLGNIEEQVDDDIAQICDDCDEFPCNCEEEDTEEESEDSIVS
jgi:hypothetical protein